LLKNCKDLSHKGLSQAVEVALGVKCCHAARAG
jgi:hypothetical protein